jgi:hypothetical protein
MATGNRHGGACGEPRARDGRWPKRIFRLRHVTKQMSQGNSFRAVPGRHTPGRVVFFKQGEPDEPRMGRAHPMPALAYSSASVPVIKATIPFAGTILPPPAESPLAVALPNPMAAPVATQALFLSPRVIGLPTQRVLRRQPSTDKGPDTAALATAPTAARSMSLCASQMSPWIPRYAMPNSWSTTKAAPHSVSS